MLGLGLEMNFNRVRNKLKNNYIIEELYLIFGYKLLFYKLLLSISFKEKTEGICFVSNFYD
jgi:hypothetical protein